jgi:hypothetical protein
MPVLTVLNTHESLPDLAWFGSADGERSDS